MATHPHLHASALPFPKLKRAVWLAMASMTMFFLALTYAYLQRHGLASGWMSPRLAEILSANTCLLLASSIALHRGRRFLAGRGLDGAVRWTAAALGLGVAFLLGQAEAWRVLWQAGVYLAQNPNSGFFYLVTAAHAAHLAVALGLMVWVLMRLWRGRLPPDRPLLMDVTAIFWHCLDITWIYVFAVLLVYRG